MEFALAVNTWTLENQIRTDNRRITGVIYKVAVGQRDELVFIAPLTINVQSPNEKLT
jgi:hypothetical protein